MRAIFLRVAARCAAMLLAVLTLCACAGTPPSPADILTQKRTEEGRTQITVLVKYAFTINGFEKAVEEKFPNIDLVQVGNYTRDMGIAEYASRLEHGDITDIVMTWPLDVGEEYWEDRLLDLSGMSFTSRYNLSMLNSISRGGKLYYLPGPAQVRGIVYNKTLFEENGWQVPKDYEGFLELCKTIEESGMRSIQLGFQNGEVLDTAFVGYNYANYYSKPQDVQWLADYNSGRGRFEEHFGGAFDVFQQMADAGIWRATDLEIDYAEREKLLFTRGCAMAEDSVLMARMGFDQTGTTDEFALMPFFNPGEHGDWARLYMVCFIGLNKELASPGNEEKYELVKQVMDYISTPQGQAALAADTGAMFSSLTGATPPQVPEIEALVPALSHGRYAVFPTLQNAQGALREGLAGMLRGQLTKQDVCAMVDAQNLAPPVPEQPRGLGIASARFSMVETGNFVTDAMRSWSGCEVALFLDNGKDGRYNGKGISGVLYEGSVTTLDVARILPDLKHGEKGTVWKTSMTGADLINTLEYSIPVDNNATGWFYYFSGLKMTYDPVAAPGERIQRVTTADGKELDPARVYTVAVMDETVPNAYLKTCEDTGVAVAEVLEQAIEKAGTISPSGDGRFQVA